MRPISELRFEHGKVLLLSLAGDLVTGSMTTSGMIAISFCSVQFLDECFVSFLPLSEIAQLQEGK
jgi:hypothetical protein